MTTTTATKWAVRWSDRQIVECGDEGDARRQWLIHNDGRPQFPIHVTTVLRDVGSGWEETP